MANRFRVRDKRTNQWIAPSLHDAPGTTLTPDIGKATVYEGETWREYWRWLDGEFEIVEIDEKGDK